MAQHIAKGAENEGINTILKKVEKCTIHDLTKVDSIAVGSLTYYSNIS